MENLLFWIYRSRDVSEDRLDLCLYLVNVNVSYNDDSLKVWTAPSLIEACEALISECLELLLATDEGPLCIWSVTIIIWKRLLEKSPASISSCTSLLKDHTSLCVDLGRVVCHEVRVVVEDEKARVKDALPYDRDVVEHVLCLLEACRSVDVASELSSDALEPVEELLAREVFCTVEAHVLEEVSKTVLVVFLLECSDVSREVEFRSLSRLVVVADVIGHAVLKLSCSYCRVVWKRCLTERHCGSEDRCNEDE